MCSVIVGQLLSLSDAQSLCYMIEVKRRTFSSWGWFESRKEKDTVSSSEDCNHNVVRKMKEDSHPYNRTPGNTLLPATHAANMNLFYEPPWLLLLLLSRFSRVWPHRRQPTRLPHPCDSPGKNTGVGCHFLLQHTKVKSESEVTQSCLTLSDPLDCSPPGSSIHGIFQARVLGWGAIASSD